MSKDPTTFICESANSAESRAISHVCMVNSAYERQWCPEAQLENHAAELASGQFIPVGSVSYIEMAMKVAGTTPPKPMTYPGQVAHLLMRPVSLVSAAEAKAQPQPIFVKPAKTKLFTGFVYGLNKESDAWDLETFLSLPDSEPIYVSPVVPIESEVRFYFDRGQFIGSARYDPYGEDEAKLPTEDFARMVASLLRADGQGFTGAIDLGYRSTCGSFLVEVNDAWALGLYKGMDRLLYAQMLASRWRQITSPSSQIGRPV